MSPFRLHSVCNHSISVRVSVICLVTCVSNGQCSVCLDSFALRIMHWLHQLPDQPSFTFAARHWPPWATQTLHLYRMPGLELDPRHRRVPWITRRPRVANAQSTTSSQPLAREPSTKTRSSTTCTARRSTQATTCRRKRRRRWRLVKRSRCQQRYATWHKLNRATAVLTGVLTGVCTVLQRVQSNIPKAGTDSTWLYPSPQMFFNALTRKRKRDDDVQEEDMATVVAVHNNMNERAWLALEKWERCHEG